MNRTREQVIWDFVQGWLRKAEGDLHVSEVMMEMDLEDWFAVAFHAQQAAEKYLKAFLVRHQIPFPKTHVIQQLLKLAARGGFNARVRSRLLGHADPIWDRISVSRGGYRFGDSETGRLRGQAGERDYPEEPQELLGYRTSLKWLKLSSHMTRISPRFQCGRRTCRRPHTFKSR